MNHIFITRLAVYIASRRNPPEKVLQTRCKVYDCIEDRISDIIKYWLVHASRFYTQQTIDHPFKVMLVYDPMYENTVKQFNFPSWVELTTDIKIDRLGTHSKFLSQYDNSKLSVSRIDADDWFSNDYFEYLAQDHPPTITREDHELSVHLHKRIIQYQRSEKWSQPRVSNPVRFSSPGFASYTFNNFNTKDLRSFGLRLWPHGNIKKYNHITPETIYGLQSVGINVANKWRHRNTSSGPEVTDRFYIPATLDF
jgi:hypothetical protein